MIVIAICIPSIAFIVAILDGIWCLVTKREGLLDWMGYH